MEKVVRSTLSEQITQRIQSKIDHGEWPVGTCIPSEKELVRQFGVSRNTVREAVRSFVHSGMMEVRQGDGTYVISGSGLKSALRRQFSRSKWRDTLEVRLALEIEGARLAASRRTEPDLSAIRYCRIRCESLSRTEDKQAFVEADVALHCAVIKAAHNQILDELYRQMCDLVPFTIAHVLQARPKAQQKIDDIHGQLIESIAASDPDTAEEAVRKYMMQLRIEGEKV